MKDSPEPSPARLVDVQLAFARQHARDVKLPDGSVKGELRGLVPNVATRVNKALMAMAAEHPADWMALCDAGRKTEALAVLVFMRELHARQGRPDEKIPAEHVSQGNTARAAQVRELVRFLPGELDGLGTSKAELRQLCQPLRVDDPDTVA